MAPRGLLLPILLAAAGLTLTSPVPVSAAEPGEVTGVRLGRHAGFLRLVFDLTAPPDYAARATGARAFDVTLSGTSLPPEGHAALAADPLAPDLTVRPAADGGPLRFRVVSRHDAYIRRAFVLDPTAGGTRAQAENPWRLVLDIVPRPGRGAAPAPAAAGRLAALPPLHGMAGAEPAAPSPDAPGPVALSDQPVDPPAQVEVSWARASKILRELQARRAPDADTPAPQLVLAPKYRRQGTVPLR